MSSRIPEASATWIGYRNHVLTGLNFGNSDKAAWIRLLRNVTGRNADNIKQRLNFRFDEDQTQKDLRYVAGCLKELFPSISSKIERDSKIQ